MKEAMDEHRKQKEALEQKPEDKEIDEDDEEDDEEEREELMEILEQGRDEIARLEEENQKQLETINDLKEKFLAKGLEVPVIENGDRSRDNDDDEEEEE